MMTGGVESVYMRRGVIWWLFGGRRIGPTVKNREICILNICTRE